MFALDNAADPREIRAFTLDSANAATYSFRVKVFYIDYFQNPGATKDFTIDITDTCETNPTITPSTLGD